MLTNWTDISAEVLTHVLSHLSPETLSSMSLVSKRFHKLVTTPHAWRIAFARFFPGQDNEEAFDRRASTSDSDTTRSERRVFTRLSALASWRSEYILRTRLLRSLGRGRPSLQAVPRAAASRSANNSAAAVVTYGSSLLYPVSNIHATFGVGLNKKQPLFIHGALEQGLASTSDPSFGKVANWGLTDFELFKHFADLYIGEVEYGLGSGDLVGMSNVMDLSQPYGKIYGEACPGGRPFYTSVSEQRGRFLSVASDPVHNSGIPKVNVNHGCVCSVWIAKSERILRSTGGVFGMLAGFSNGILAAYALGVNLANERRFEKGELSAKWALCPGVPIVAIAVDENISAHRQDLRRVWAVVLNALGEVFYLTNAPSSAPSKGRLKASELELSAWETGRSFEWQLLQGTLRIAKSDPFELEAVDGVYSPRSSSHLAGLSSEQVATETREIEKYLAFKPKHFRHVCEGWDMQRKLVVDFAGDDGHRAGEAVFVVNSGHDGAEAVVRRYTRYKSTELTGHSDGELPNTNLSSTPSSLFGGSPKQSSQSRVVPPQSKSRSRTSSADIVVSGGVDHIWCQSHYTFGDLRNVQITAVATDESDFATLATFEDPLLGMSGGSNTSSPLASPLGRGSCLSSPSDIPGHRARYLAAGTNTGIVVLWDIRVPNSTASDSISTIRPLRAIYTKSPQISSLALTSLYLVHGGNDGLVQAWDPLASTTEPIRTLNSRFSDRARRRIAQAEASAHGVGNNYYAAGAIALDPDPTVLRGMVSLGTHLRYWSYSASAADAYKSRKRGQLRRRSERGSNSAANEQKYSHTGRGILNDYIATERQEMERERLAKQKELERLSGRYGTDLLGEDASEEDLLKYAMMVSEETWENDVARQDSDLAREEQAMRKAGYEERSKPSQQADHDLEEAIRLSLLESELGSASPFAPAPAPPTDDTADFQIPIRYAKASRTSRHGPPTSNSTSIPKSQAEASVRPDVHEREQGDLEFAMQLSLAEERSRREVEAGSEEVAAGEEVGAEENGKGKGRARG